MKTERLLRSKEASEHRIAIPRFASLKSFPSFVSGYLECARASGDLSKRENRPEEKKIISPQPLLCRRCRLCPQAG